MSGVRNRVPIKNYFPFFVRKGEGGRGYYTPNPYIFSLSIKTVIGGYQESNAFGIISKEEDHGRLQVGEKSRNVIDGL